MKRLLFSLLLIPGLALAQTTRDVQKKASRQTANVETLTADKTLTYLDAETQILTPSGGNRIVTLPTTSVWKSWTVKIINEDTANTLIIKSSDGDTLDTLTAIGKVEYVARQVAPTDTLHWTNISKIGTLGVTDGSSACVGCVGEKIQATISAMSLGTSEADITGGSLPLTKGTWEITYSVSMDVAAGATSGNGTYGAVVITDASNTMVGNTYRALYVKSTSAVSNTCITALSSSTIVNLSADATYKLRGYRIDSAGVGGASIVASGVNRSTFFAVRKR